MCKKKKKRRKYVIKEILAYTYIHEKTTFTEAQSHTHTHSRIIDGIRQRTKTKKVFLSGIWQRPHTEVQHLNRKTTSFLNKKRSKRKKRSTKEKERLIVIHRKRKKKEKKK